MEGKGGEVRGGAGRRKGGSEIKQLKQANCRTH